MISPHRPRGPAAAAALFAMLVLLLAPRPAAACLWDYDTLRDEQRGLPSVAAVLAGRWEKHSAFFYEDRATRMRERLGRDAADLDAYDNLAVALEKLGRTAEAIDVAERKRAINPDGYTTYANLGTFYIHAGDLDRGIEHIRRALEINPDAHFGREEYQLRLAEFLREHRGKPPGDYPLADFLGLNHFIVPKDGSEPFPSPLIARGSPQRLAAERLKPNVFDGVVGMIRFGTGTSPDLYYALGNLLALRGDKHLAYRAYQRAIDHGHPRAADLAGVRDRLLQSVGDSEWAGPAEVARRSRAEIARERADADAWVAAYRDHEDALIRAGRDVGDEANHAAFYAEHGSARPTPGFAPSDYLPRSPLNRLALLAAGVLTGGFLLLPRLARRLWRRRRLARRRPATTPA